MKQLLLIRHAKTEQKGYDKDMERELTERGHNDCQIMSGRLKKIGYTPDLVKSSPSARTRQTTKNLAKELGWEKEKIVFPDTIYLATHKELLDEIAGTEKNVDMLALVGHNPGITEFFNYLGDATIDNMPTCSIGLFQFEIDNWNDIDAHKGKLIWYSWPKKED